MREDLYGIYGITWRDGKIRYNGIRWYHVVKFQNIGNFGVYEQIGILMCIAGISLYNIYIYILPKC